MNSKYIERFSAAERVLHWLVSIAFFILLLSGLGLYSRLFNGFFNIFGGGENAIVFHKIAGVLFFQSSLMLFMNLKQDVSSFDEDDQAWIRAQGGYLTREEVHFNIGKYNPGQKLFALFIGAATIVFSVTGFFIWAPSLFSRWIVQVSLLLHGLMFITTVMFVIVHIYLATIGNPGTVDAMLYGYVRKVWARFHHPKWYEEETKKKLWVRKEQPD